MGIRRIQAAAPELLNAAKVAARVLNRQEPLSEETRIHALSALNAAINSAEESEWTVSFVTTPRTKELLFEGLMATYDDNALLDYLKQYCRVTARRVYFKLPVDIDKIKLLARFLKATSPGRSTSRAFDRIADHLEAEVLSKSPLEILARSGL